MVLRKRKKIPFAKIWAPKHCDIVVEACMVATNTMWQPVFQCLLRHLLDLQEAGSCVYALVSNFVKCTSVGAKYKIEVVSMWGVWLKAWHTQVGTDRARHYLMLAHNGFEEPLFKSCASTLKL